MSSGSILASNPISPNENAETPSPNIRNSENKPKPRSLDLETGPGMDSAFSFPRSEPTPLHLQTGNDPVISTSETTTNDPNHTSIHLPLKHVVIPPGIPGRQSPSTVYKQMVFFGLAGLFIAIGHHLFYRHLDGQVVGSSSWTIAGHMISSQQRIATFATGAVFLSKTFFGMCIIRSFDQQLWFTAHRKLVKIRTLETLFNAPNDPSAFFNLDMLNTAKTATFLAAIAWCLPLALIPVPGALGIARLSRISENRVVVPTVNLNPEANQGDSLAFYSPLLAYVAPSPFMMSFAARTLTAGQIAAWSSPCGPDCVYNQTFFGPSFSCSPPQSNLTGTAQLRWNAQSQTGNTSDTLSIQWLSSLDGPTQSFTTCTSYNSTYNVVVKYSNGTQTVDVHSASLQSPFGTSDPLAWRSPGISPSNPHGLALLAAIKDSVTLTLTGSIVVGKQTGADVTQTLVLYSTLPSYGNLSASSSLNGATLIFPPTVPQLIESLLHNITISLISTSFWNTSVVAAIQSSDNFYSYDPKTLWAGYGTSIAITLVAMVTGIMAVWSNGGGGNRSFPLLIGTTRNPHLDNLFKMSDTKGLNQLKETKLMFGCLNEEISGDRERWAFGTDEDLRCDEKG